MAWIELHQTVRHHPKIKALARALGVKRACAIGHVTSLWLYALEFAPSGDLSRFESQDLADEMFYDGKVDVKEALTTALFLNADGTLHDWRTYAGRLLDKRAMDAERKRTARERGVKPSGPALESPCPVQRKSNGQDADGSTDGARTAQVTVPYRTVPKATATTAAAPPAASKSAGNGNGNGNGLNRPDAKAPRTAENGKTETETETAAAGKAAEAAAAYGNGSKAETAESWQRWAYCAEALRRQGWLNDSEMRQLLHECRRWWREDRKRVPDDLWFHGFLGNLFHTQALNDGGQSMANRVGFVLTRVKNSFAPKEHYATLGTRAYNHVETQRNESPGLRARLDGMVREMMAEGGAGTAGGRGLEAESAEQAYGVTGRLGS